MIFRHYGHLMLENFRQYLVIKNQLLLLLSQLSVATVVREAARSGALQKQQNRKKVAVGSKVDSKVKPVVT